MRLKLGLMLNVFIVLFILLSAYFIITQLFSSKNVSFIQKNLEDVNSKNEGFHRNNEDGVDIDQVHLHNDHLKSHSNDVVNKQKDSNIYPILNWRKLGNYEEVINFRQRSGPGEYGARVSALPSEKEAVSQSIKEFGFNMVNSDKISLDRLPKDLRHQECRHWDYSQSLSRISVIIVFHNEGWSTLVRTVHSVVNLTPKHLLAEIVMIDDHSSKEHLGDRLASYILRFNGIVKLYRNKRREGLIRARSIGAEHSLQEPGIILVYLDAHCEVGYNWLPPLITPIVNNRKVATVPLIDVINGQDYTFTPQAGGDSNGFARGAWDWSMLWKRIPLGKKERERRKHTTDPYRSPAMAGGLFAIDRAYFFDIGLYDPGLEIWGGENFELSFKIWMCGGEVLFVPCSRVGHVYRLPGWSGNPPPEYVPANPSLRNYMRVVETWWDEYKDFFYASRPEVINMPYGDISAQVNYRNKNKCKSFQWFMEEIAYDVLDHYPLPPKNKEWGEIRALGTKQCLDSMGHKNGDGQIEVGYCHRMGGNQLFRLSEANQLAQYDQCVTIIRGQITLMHCDTTQFKEWDHVQSDKSIFHKTTRTCLEYTEHAHNVFLTTCDPSKPTQHWEINKIQSTHGRNREIQICFSIPMPIPKEINDSPDSD